jgi:signal transduction histidine kinase
MKFNDSAVILFVKYYPLAIFISIYLFFITFHNTDFTIFIAILPTFFLYFYCLNLLDNQLLKYKNDLNQAHLINQKKDTLLLQQSKLATMGEMIGNIAHQWRQPLSAITSATSGIKLQQEYNLLKENDLNEVLNGIMRNANYLSQTIDDFRNFYNPKSHKELFDINLCINNALNLIQTQFLSYNIVILHTLSQKNFTLYGIQNQLIQVILNILNNAKDQLQSNNNSLKIIKISTFQSHQHAIISIKDNGGGIKAENIQDLFEPYFTTKPTSKGTGIGLYMSKKIIQTHFKGNIFARNSVFTAHDTKLQGAVFHIVIPKDNN